MTTNLFGLIILAAGLVIQLLHHRHAVHLMVSLTLFGSAAALVLPSLGGASILVPTVFTLFFCWRVCRVTGLSPVLGALLHPSAGFWLMLLTAYGVFATLFYPKLMAGITDTMLVQRLPGGVSRIALSPLTFTNSHITQTAYALGGLACFAFAFAVFRSPRAYQHLLTGIFLVCGLNITFAVLDLVTYSTGTGELLDFVHTANYSLMTNVEMSGLKRIAGTFSEASAFASFTLILFAIVASLHLDGVRPKLSGGFALALLFLLILSTSATAYLGLVAVFLVLFAQSLAPIFSGGAMRKLGLTLVAGLAFVTFIAVIAATAPWFTEAAAQFFDETLLDKFASHSGRERGYWNEVAWDNFVDSAGLGVGIGGARASSYIFVLLSNVGVPGTILFVLFVGYLLFKKPHERFSTDGIKLVRAIRCGIIANLVAAILVSTVYDLGILFYLLAGAAGAAAFPASRYASESSELSPLRQRALVAR
jgi:hypothetical protein